MAVAVDKHAYHLPLERQVDRFAHQGFEVTSQALGADEIKAAPNHATTVAALDIIAKLYAVEARCEAITEGEVRPLITYFFSSVRGAA